MSTLEVAHWVVDPTPTAPTKAHWKWSPAVPVKSELLVDILDEVQAAFKNGAGRVVIRFDVEKDGAGSLRLFGRRVGQR